ncbi:DUF1707 SHOCT-like domain-containing protein [Nocardioides bruguierae]|uniref:DUF1707 SHOCT-like domain-containing protein n=1 Tax=Nocardioides bruguierae TaxID=2945102 RepID=UPI0020209869|nr:DUF1707 domain-containing protein [Nocardioides bruguierae]MCL8025795.1 DUF1707 domain-containing protein [Nocardioides bruguierae]
MTPPSAVPDPWQQRVGDAERTEVAEALRHAAGDGRLDLEELDHRLEAAFTARTYADLGPLLADLPGVASPLPPGWAPPHWPAARPGTPVPGPPVPGTPLPAQAGVVRSSTAFLGTVRREGPWRPGERHSATAVLADVKLDLRHADLPPVLVLHAVAVLGDVKIDVDPETRVVLEGTGLAGDFKLHRRSVPAELRPGSPVVRVTGTALLGSVTVRRRALPGEERARWWAR